MKKIADQVKRSTGTIHAQIKKHNISAQRSGFCPVCRRIQSKFDKDLAVREES